MFRRSPTKSTRFPCFSARIDPARRLLAVYRALDRCVTTEVRMTRQRALRDVFVLAIGLIGALLAAAAAAQPGVMVEGRNTVTRFESGPLPAPDPLRHVPDELLVRLKPRLSQAAAARALSAVALQSSRRFRAVEHLYHLKLAHGVSLQQALRTFRRHPDVLYAEPNYRIEAFAAPNDPSFGSQWSLANTG